MPAAGGRVKTQRLLRSDFPQSFGAEDVEYFQEIPTSAVLDLRDADEVDASPHYFADAGFNVVENPIGVGSAASMMTGIPSVAELYQEMLAQSPKQLAKAVSAVAAAVPTGAALVHCTAGKDRTGVVIALTQAVLGVSDEDIVANYVSTHANLDGEWQQLMEAKIEKGLAALPASMREKFSMADIVPLMTGSPAPAIQGVLDTIRKAHGTVDQFLLTNGVTQQELDTLRAELVVPAS